MLYQHIECTGNKTKKYVEAAKGTNLFFAVYLSEKEDGQKVRLFVSIPLKVAINCQVKGLKDWKLLLDQWAHNEGLVSDNDTLLFVLSPGDLVYLPTEGETKIDKSRIYKMVSGSGTDWYFTPCSFASTIVQKVEFGPLNKTARSFSGEMIKEICIPIQVDRLGNIIAINND